MSSSSAKTEADATIQRDAQGRPKHGFARRLLWRIGEKVGHVETTNYPAHYLSAANELELYKVVADDVTKRLSAVVQQDARVLNNPERAMNFDYPADQNPFERAHRSLVDAAEHLDRAEMLQLAATMKALGSAHREYQQKARRALHFLRTFINVDFDSIMSEREKLEENRRDMDYAKHQLKSAKAPEQIEARNSAYEASRQQYEAQLKKVLKLLENTKQQKATHANEVVRFHAVYRAYHENMAKTLKSPPPPLTSTTK